VTLEAVLTALGQLPDGELDLADAAVQLARVDLPGADWAGAQASLSALAREASELAPGDVPGLGALLARQGFRGDHDTYDDPANANMIRVLERRRGLPVALGILWLHCARAAGWEADGLDLPGHFVLAVHGTQPVVIDPFEGIALDAPALRALCKRVGGPGAELRPGALRPVGNRAVLLRLQNNILLRRAEAGDLAGAVACASTMLLLAPEAASLWRERAQLQERMGEIGGAMEAWTRFLALVPEGRLADNARAALTRLRATLH